MLWHRNRKMIFLLSFCWKVQMATGRRVACGRELGQWKLWRCCTTRTLQHNFHDDDDDDDEDDVCLRFFAESHPASPILSISAIPSSHQSRFLRLVLLASLQMLLVSGISVRSLCVGWVGRFWTRWAAFLEGSEKGSEQGLRKVCSALLSGGGRFRKGSGKVPKGRKEKISAMNQILLPKCWFPCWQHHLRQLIAGAAFAGAAFVAGRLVFRLFVLARWSWVLIPLTFFHKTWLIPPDCQTQLNSCMYWSIHVVNCNLYLIVGCSVSRQWHAGMNSHWDLHLCIRMDTSN